MQGSSEVIPSVQILASYVVVVPINAYLTENEAIVMRYEDIAEGFSVVVGNVTVQITY